MEYYVDPTFGDLRKLEAGNLYFTIIIKSKGCTKLNSPVHTFEMIDGNEDVKKLKEIYEKEQAYNPLQTGIQFISELDRSYNNLVYNHNSTNLLTEQAIEKYRVIQKHYFGELTEEEILAFFQSNVGDYLENNILSFLKTEKVHEK